MKCESDLSSLSSSEVNWQLALNDPVEQLGAGMAHWCERSPPTNVAWVQFQCGAISGLSLLLVLALLRGFFSGFSGFPPSRKTNISNFQFNHNRGPAWKPARADEAYSLNIVIYLVNIFIILGECWPMHSLRSIHVDQAQHLVLTERTAEMFLQQDSDQSKCISCEAHTKDVPKF